MWGTFPGVLCARLLKLLSKSSGGGRTKGRGTFLGVRPIGLGGSFYGLDSKAPGRPCN